MDKVDDVPGADPKPAAIEHAAVVLLLEVTVEETNRESFLEFCRRAFPVYESPGGNQMHLYEDRAQRGRFVEIGYYRTEADYERAEHAIGNDPVHEDLIERWRGVVTGDPTVRVLRYTSEASSV